MLLNNENVDYLSEWPAHYYEIEDINERERILQLAIEQKLDPALDEKRLLILRKRFGDHPAEKRADLFLRAWMMIQAASAGGVSFFQKKRQKKELCGYLMQLGIRTDEKQNVEKDADVEDVCGYILEEEWKNFAYLSGILYRKQGVLLHIVWYRADQRCSSCRKDRTGH